MHAGAPATGDAAAVTVTNGAYAWDPLRKPLLSSLNFTVRAGSCVVIIGEVGCGKSSLLAALLGEMPRVRGTAALRGSVAYTAQDPWIQNATVEANILMGTAMDTERYARVLHACALQADLASLPAGDQTEIGEKGVNLSGACCGTVPVLPVPGRCSSSQGNGRRAPTQALSHKGTRGTVFHNHPGTMSGHHTALGGHNACCPCMCGCR